MKRLAFYFINIKLRNYIYYSQYFSDKLIVYFYNYVEESTILHGG